MEWNSSSQFHDSIIAHFCRLGRRAGDGTSGQVDLVTDEFIDLGVLAGFQSSQRKDSWQSRIYFAGFPHGSMSRKPMAITVSPRKTPAVCSGPK